VNKAQLTDAVAVMADLPRAVAARALDAVLSKIVSALAEGDSVALVGFGTFAVKNRPARTGRNPKTGQPLLIPEAMIPSFKAGKVMKEAVSEPKQVMVAEEA
jgi:DNA-binding protein HU-beta